MNASKALLQANKNEFFYCKVAHHYDQLRLSIRLQFCCIVSVFKGESIDVTSERPLQLVAALLLIEALLLYNWASLWHSVRLCVTCISLTCLLMCVSVAANQPDGQPLKHLCMTQVYICAWCLMVDASLPSAWSQRSSAEWHIGSSTTAFIAYTRT